MYVHRAVQRRHEPRGKPGRGKRRRAGGPSSQPDGGRRLEDESRAPIDRATDQFPRGHIRSIGEI